jgi:putative NIF3 family GTP cyclohydrolase 1 type 2
MRYEMSRISRREFVTIASAAPFALSRRTGAMAITAQEIVDRIRKNVGVEWNTETVDTFKAGDPATVVTGVVTTAMATLDVLRRAVEAGANLVITCEPTFYGRGDSPTPPPRRGAGPGDAGRGGAGANPPDPVFAAKADFIRKHNLVVWRFNEHWRLRRPDPFAQGLVDVLGWSRLRLADDPARVTIPEIGLATLAAQVHEKLNARGGVRVVGDVGTRVQKVAVLPGATSIQASLRALPAVDAIVAGEVREWESVEYARDAITAGEEKGLILVGRVLSEEPGMNACAQWVRTLVPETATTWIPVGDPYWRPL